MGRKACDALRIRQLVTKAYRPRTNGKAERFIRTMRNGWAYQQPAARPDQRRPHHGATAFLERYNTKRPHRSLNGQTSMQRLAEKNQTAAAYNQGSG
jgi:transposase InsO family protein